MQVNELGVGLSEEHRLLEDSRNRSWACVSVAILVRAGGPRAQDTADTRADGKAASRNSSVEGCFCIKIYVRR